MFLLILVRYFALLWCTLQCACCRHLIFSYLFGCAIVAVFVVMDKVELRGVNLGIKDSQMRAAESTEGVRPSKAAWKMAPCDTRRSKDIPVSRRQDMKDEEVEVERLR